MKSASRCSVLNSYRFNADTAQVFASSIYQVAPAVCMNVQKPAPARVVGGLPESPVGAQTPLPMAKSNCLGCQEIVPSAKKSPMPKVLPLNGPPGVLTLACW